MDSREDLTLTPVDNPGSHRTGTIGGSYDYIVKQIGFEENIDEGSYKVEASWSFEDQHGRVASVWCYKQGKKWCSSWSCYGDSDLLKAVFGNRYHNEKRY